MEKNKKNIQQINIELDSDVSSGEYANFVVVTHSPAEFVLDFLEFLMANGIVDNLDFFDPEVYSEDVDDLDQTKEEEGDPSEFEKKKDHYNIYENELLPEDKTDENIKEYSQFEGLNDEWEDFNERDFENSKG